MFTPSFRITPAILTNVEQLGRVMGFLQAVRLPGPYAQELLAALEVEIVHASTAIEGNTLTQEQVTEVLRGRPVQVRSILCSPLTANGTSRLGWSILLTAC